MAKDQPRRSIIDHTTTCPYCGHRLLHQNLTSHIRNLHPSEAEDEGFSQKIKHPGPIPCPYCQKQMEVRELEAHLQKEHPKIVHLVNRLETAKEKKEQAERRKKLKEIADKFDAPVVREREFDDRSQGDWKPTHQKQQPRNKPLKKPSKVIIPPTVNGSANAPGRTAQPATVIQWTNCPICKVKIKANRLNRHLRKLHPG